MRSPGRSMPVGRVPSSLGVSNSQTTPSAPAGEARRNARVRLVGRRDALLGLRGERREAAVRDGKIARRNSVVLDTEQKPSEWRVNFKSMLDGARKHPLRRTFVVGEGLPWILNPRASTPPVTAFATFTLLSWAFALAAVPDTIVRSFVGFWLRKRMFEPGPSPLARWKMRGRSARCSSASSNAFSRTAHTALRRTRANNQLGVSTGKQLA